MPSPLLAKLDACPPFLAYYGSQLMLGKRLTVQQFVESSRLPMRTFKRISICTTWSGVRVGVMAKFCEACGVNPLDPGDLIQRVAHELQSESKPPFSEFPPRRRSTMIRLFNILSAKVAMSRLNQS